MIEVVESPQFRKWFRGLKDKNAAIAITKRINRVKGGLFGDVKSVGDGVSELRFHLSAGHRVYFLKRGLAVVILLYGGDKSSQEADIEKAKEIAKTV
jgi:putative addiction module killer protein